MCNRSNNSCGGGGSEEAIVTLVCFLISGGGGLILYLIGAGLRVSLTFFIVTAIAFGIGGVLDSIFGKRD